MARKVGLTLAAGEATRMPNKPLLPLVEPGGKQGIAVESGMLLAWGAGCTLLRVLTPPSPILELTLRMRSWRQVAYITQPEPRGFGEALHDGVLDLEDNDRVLVTFCDNVYSPKEAADTARWVEHDRPVASVRALADLPEAEQAQLDYFSNETGQWCARVVPPPEDRLYFAGWLIASAGTLRQARGMGAVELLNALDFDPVIMEHEWHEVGTPAGYERYLRARHYT